MLELVGKGRTFSLYFLLNSHHDFEMSRFRVTNGYTHLMWCVLHSAHTIYTHTQSFAHSHTWDYNGMLISLDTAWNCLICKNLCDMINKISAAMSSSRTHRSMDLCVCVEDVCSCFFELLFEVNKVVFIAINAYAIIKGSFEQFSAVSIKWYVCKYKARYELVCCLACPASLQDSIWDDELKALYRRIYIQNRRPCWW